MRLDKQEEEDEEEPKPMASQSIGLESHDSGSPAIHWDLNSRVSEEENMIADAGPNDGDNDCSDATGKNADSSSSLQVPGREASKRASVKSLISRFSLA